MIKRFNDPLNEIHNKQDTQPVFSATEHDFRVSHIRPLRVLALGDPTLVATIKEDLESKGIQVQGFRTAKALAEAATGREEALIYCAPLLRSEIISIHSGLLKKAKLRNMCAFAIVPDWVNAHQEREMYSKGIRMIFEWPRERTTFSSTLSAALKQETLPVDSKDADKSLRKALLNRMLSQKGEFQSNLEISVYNGIVILRGSVESVGEAAKISKFVEAVPGVKGVVDTSLHVGKGRLPGFVRLRANQMLDEMEGVPSQTLIIDASPDEQRLTLLGTASSEESLDRAKQRLSLFKGVKKIESKVEVSPKVHARDLALAKQAQRLVNKITHGHPHSAKVKILHGRAVLNGDVISSIESSQLVNALRDLPGIQDVENHLEVDTIRATSNM